MDNNPPLISVGFGETGLRAWPEEPDIGGGAVLLAAGWTVTEPGFYAAPGPADLDSFRAAIQRLRTAANGAGAWIESPSPELLSFTAKLADALPGWGPPDVSLPSGGLPYLREDIWDRDSLMRDAFDVEAMSYATILPGPDGAELALTAKAGDPGRYLVGVVAPSAGLSGVELPILDRAVTVVGHDAAEAAAELISDLIPRYEQAVWEFRTAQLAAAVDRMDALVREAEAVESGLQDDTPGRGPRERHLSASQPLTVFLELGPRMISTVLQSTTFPDVRKENVADLAEVWHLRSVLDRARQVRAQWTQVEALVSTPPSGSAFAGRQAMHSGLTVLWRYAREIPWSGAALVRVAESFTPDTWRPLPPPRARAAAASAAVGLSPGQPRALPTTDVPPASRPRTR